MKFKKYEIVVEPYTKETVNDYEYMVVTRKETRFRIVDKNTGRVLDDASGRGYLSSKSALDAWNYKSRKSCK